MCFTLFTLNSKTRSICFSVELVFLWAPPACIQEQLPRNKFISLKWWSLLATSSSFNFTVGFPALISVFMKHEQSPRTVEYAYRVVYELVTSSSWQKPSNKTPIEVIHASFPLSLKRTIICSACITAWY